MTIVECVVAESRISLVAAVLQDETSRLGISCCFFLNLLCGEQHAVGSGSGQGLRHFNAIRNPSVGQE